MITGLERNQSELRSRLAISLVTVLMLVSAIANISEDSQGDPTILDHGNGLYESVWDFQSPANYTLTNTTIANGSVILNSTESWWNQTSQSDFENATSTININTSAKPGEIRLDNTSTATNLSRTIQPGPLDNKDSYIMSGGGQNMNYGSSNQLRLVGGAPNIIKRIFIQFNLSSIPPTSRISEARLQLCFYQSIAGNPTNVSVHRVTHWWSEMGLTYNDYDGTHPWTTAGGDFDPFGYDVQMLQDGAFGWISWDVTALLQSWLDGSYASHGFLLKQVNDSTETGIDPTFYSSDDVGFPERRPRLVVNFSSLDLIQNGAFSTDSNWSYDRSPGIMAGWNPLEQNAVFEHTADSHPNSSVEVLARSGGGTGGDGDPVDEVRWDDEGRFVVGPMQDVFLDVFDTTGLSGGIDRVILNAQYMVEALDYHGYNAIEYMDCQGIVHPSEIQPLPNEIMDTDKSYDITSSCNPWTWPDVSNIQLYFMNDDIKNNRFVAFDRIWLTIELETFNETAYLNQTFTKSIRTGFLDTTQDDFKKGDVSTVDIDLRPGDVVLQSTSETRTIPIQPDPIVMKDSTLMENLPDQNFGVSPFLELSYDPMMGGESRAILNFDTVALPPATINSALLRLYFTQDIGLSNLTVTVNRILSPWDEISVTWNDRMALQPWTRAGGDINLWSYDTITINSGNFGWVEWNITELVRGWVNRDFPNYGLMLRALGGDVQSPYRFSSSDSLSPLEWPEILLNVSARIHQLTGTYISPVETYNPDKLDAYIQWSGTTLPGVTDLVVQTRTGTDPDPILSPDQWELWKPSISYTNSSGQLIESSPAPYVQYRVILNTTTPNETPVLSEVSIVWRAIDLSFDSWVEGQDGLTVVNLTVVIDSVPVWNNSNLSLISWRTDRSNVSKHLVDPGSHNISFQLRLETNKTGPSKLVLLLDNVTTRGIVQDWANGVFYSEIYDASHKVIWGNISWNATTPPSTIVAIGTRSGSSPFIDGGWSPWSSYSISSGEPIQSPAAQYIQYQVYLVTTNSANNPSVSDVNISYRHHFKEGEVETVDFIPSNVTSWDVFNANVTLQTNTSIEFFHSTDSGGSWNSTTPGENLSSVPIPKIRFKAILWTDNGSLSPELLEMKLLYWVRIVGPLDHIHMSQDIWTGTADEWVDLDGIGHDASHAPVSFQANWSTTDPRGTVSSSGLYEPGLVGTWRVYCNNTNNTISNFTTVTVLPGSLSRIAVDPWQVSPLTTDDEVLFNATGYDSDDNPLGPVDVIWTVSGGIGTLDPGPSNSTLFSATTPGTGNITADDGNGHTNTTDDLVVTVGSISRVGINPWNPGPMTTDDTVIFDASYYDSDGNVVGPASVFWSVNGGIGSIPTGPSTSATLNPTTVGVGNVSCNDGLGHTNTSKDFTVTEGALDHIIMTPSLVNLYRRQEQLFQASGFDMDGNPVSIINSSWETNAGAIIGSNVTNATLEASDTLLSNGWMRITATSQGNIIGAAIVNVIDEPQNPSITSIIPDQVKIEDYGSWVLDLSSYASDPQDDLSGLSWYFIGVDRSIVQITGENVPGNHLITFTTVHDKYGNNSASVWLKDSDGNVDSQLIWVNITPINDRPTIESITPFSLHYDVPYPYHFYDYVYDVETPKGDLVLYCSDQEHTIINGLWITFTYPEEYFGTTVYPIVTVRDEAGAEASTLIAITVTDDNVPVLETELPDVTLWEDQFLQDHFDLDDYFSDPDGDSLYYVHGNTHINITIDPVDHTVDFWADTDWFGVETVSFKAIDPHNARAEDLIVVTVLPINDPPRIFGVPDLVVHYDTPADPDYNYTFDLAPYVSDVDNALQELNVTTSYPSYIQFYPPNNLRMVIHFPESMKGLTLDVVITVSDGVASDIETIKVTVSENWPPEMIQSLPDIFFLEDESYEDAFNISASFVDRDGDILFYSYGNLSVIVDINATTGLVSFSSVKDWFGSEIVTFRATDPLGGLAECGITVTVRPVNDEPVIEPIPKQVIHEGQDWTLDLREYVYDVDNSFSELEITLANGYPNYVYHAGGIVVFEYPQGVRRDFVLITVSDGNRTSYASFEVEIIPQDTSSQPDTMSWFWFLLLLLLASIVASLILRKQLTTMRIEDAYVIYGSGKLIDHVTKHDSLKVDEDIFSAMLTAIKDYAEGSLTQRGAQARLRILEFGKKRILIERGRFIYLAVVYTGTETKKDLDVLKDVLERIEDKYQNDLKDWSGSLEELEGLEEEVKEIFGSDKDKVISSMGDRGSDGD